MMPEIHCPMCNGDAGVLGSLGHFLVSQCRDCGYEWQVAGEDDAIDDDADK